MVHGNAGLLWWIELKMKGRPLAPEQQAWGGDLQAARQDWRCVRGRAGLDALLDAMVTEPRMAAP
jgi:hypothetical protein